MMSNLLSRRSFEILFRSGPGTVGTVDLHDSLSRLNHCSSDTGTPSTPVVQRKEYRGSRLPRLIHVPCRPRPVGRRARRWLWELRTPESRECLTDRTLTTGSLPVSKDHFDSRRLKPFCVFYTLQGTVFPVDTPSTPKPFPRYHRCGISVGTSVGSHRVRFTSTDGTSVTWLINIRYVKFQDE